MSAGLGYPYTRTTTGEGHADRSRLSSAASISESTEGNQSHFEIERDQQIHQLVRKFTAQSEQIGFRSTADDALHHRLDPNSEQFRPRDWARAFYDLRYNSEEAVPRVAGVAFRGLNVWGKGSPTDFQSTVGNMILKLPSLFGKGTSKIEILRDLDGLVLPGEQLCVLGPPG